ncbi:sensor histidine kinase [Robertmurraya massiliosenegalensis]|uniref:sensor histidine kinase n=1 Tax=Robertmurraya massiliosenegalensis TaxID=1287657 RepID=UPI0002EA9A88|nr:ATP-binding protein [Robertmurraya massiliosenegalensis]
MDKVLKSCFPKKVLWRLTLTNIIVIAIFIILSSWAIYNTACFLVDGMGQINAQKQNEFNTTLFQYLWLFSVSVIIMGSVVHFYLTTKLIKPLNRLIESTKIMKQGHYPEPIKVKSDGEIEQLILHFNELVQQLKNNQQFRQKLISDLSHEFRTPLSNLNGYLNALSNGVIEGNPKLYESLQQESKRLTHMVEQFEILKEWDYASIQNFTERQHVDMRLLIEQSVEMFKWLLDQRGIKVELQTEYGIVTVINGGIPQVISNLIDNAIRYYEGTGPIIIKGEALDEDYLVTVSGPSQRISDLDQERIFERFYRTDSSRNSETGGTGLGLSISKEIVEHHNGKIGLLSNQNYNSFWFTLPLGRTT